MEIVDKESTDVFDVSDLVFNITYGTSLEGQAGKLTFSLLQDPTHELHLSMGSLVRFWCGEAKVFKGYIFRIKTDEKGEFSVTAYDQMRYLQNHNYYFMKDENLVDVFKKICTDEKITDYKILGEARNLTKADNLEPYHFNDVSDFDIIQHAINETNSKYISEKVYNDDGTYVVKFTTAEDRVGYKFFIRDNFGTLELNDIENNVNYRQTGIEGDITRAWTGSEWYYYDPTRRVNLEPLIIGEESLLSRYEYELDIDSNTYNQIHLMETIKGVKDAKDKSKNNRRLALSKDNPECIRKWGVLRKIINLKINYSDATQSEKERIEEYLKLQLAESSQVSKTLKIYALGYNGVNAGDGFLLQIKSLGINEMVYVVSAVHKYDGDMHTMELDVSTSRNFTEVLK